MSAGAAHWTPPPATAKEEEAATNPSSVADVFADMLNVNEDMIMAAADCQSERDMEGAIAYQRILHRNLLEMADFIDSMFGVYSSSNDHLCSSSKTPDKLNRSVDEALPTGSADAESAVATEDRQEEDVETETKKSSALLTTLEAGEKVREIQRSNEQWMKSRHQVCEEEGVSAIMDDTAKRMAGVAVSSKQEPPAPGLELANQLLEHQHLAALLKASSSSATGMVPVQPMPSMPVFVANPMVAPAPPPLAASTAVPQFPVPMPLAPTVGQQMNLQPTRRPLRKIALPPTHSMMNLLLPMGPPLLFHPQTTGGFGAMQWAPPPMALHMAPSARPVEPTRAPAPTDFKRMCEECRKCHFSVRRCRLVLQHTAPEWQSTHPTATTRRRRRKSSKIQ